ncbi:hypothetical protein [Catellatospora methionotrophica]|uniref:hypothetical protein n=1 Tax=Catellatospora methionotrophica TaxID=121620 RepID=UPI0033F269AC
MTARAENRGLDEAKEVVMAASAHTGWTVRLLWVLAAVQLAVISVAVAVVLGDTQDRVARALQLESGDLGEVGAVVLVAGASASVLIALAVAVVSVVLTRALSRHSRPATIAVRPLAVIVALWGGGVALADPKGGPMSLFAGVSDTNGTLTGTQLRDYIDAALPAWYQSAHLVLAASMLIISMAILALAPPRRAQTRIRG